MMHDQSGRPAFLVPLAFGATALAVALSLGVLAAEFGFAAHSAAAETAPAAPPGPPLLASPKAADVVDAADAFLATLRDKERAVAQIELDLVLERAQVRGFVHRHVTNRKRSV